MVRIGLNFAVKRLSVSVDADTHRLLKVRAAETGISMNDIAWEAIKVYLQPDCKAGSEKSED